MSTQDKQDLGIYGNCCGLCASWFVNEAAFESHTCRPFSNAAETQTETRAEASPRPWKIVEDGTLLYVDAGKYRIEQHWRGLGSREELLANYQEVVKCVNAYPKLVQALAVMANAICTQPNKAFEGMVQLARQALADVEEFK